MRGGGEDLGSSHPIGASLPGVYAEDDLLQRFSGGLDAVLGPLINVLDCLPAYLRPETAPPDFLDWIGGWVGAGSDPHGDPEPVRRRAVALATAAHRLRGTRRGLAEAVALVFGVEPEITESGGATWSARPLQAFPGDPRPSVRVRLRVPDPAAVDVRRLNAVVADVCPAHLPFQVEVVQQ
ncbi:phage tail protein [Cryptosporangium japonicum]|uniref:Phage tail protein n=1 Tax=Cryptosporangium japonicum TaxID=80872 RepID=A0ABP3DBN8_9ACTN